jgi:hypothetical protein
VEVRPDLDNLKQLIVTAPEFDANFDVYGNCPVQGLGSVCGRDLFFWARHDAWTFDVANSAGNMPSDGFMDSDGFYREGTYPNAGWMPLEEAVAIIERCLQDYVNGPGKPGLNPEA